MNLFMEINIYLGGRSIISYGTLKQTLYKKKERFILDEKLQRNISNFLIFWGRSQSTSRTFLRFLTPPSPHVTHFTK